MHTRRLKTIRISISATCLMGLTALAATPVLEFDGQSRVFIEESTIFQENFGALSLEFWIKPDKIFNDFALVVHRHDADGTNIGDSFWWAGFANDGNLTVTFNARNSHWEDGKTNIKPAAGEWHHVAGAWDGTEGHVYLNGELIHSYASSAMSGNGEGLMAFGGTVGGGSDYRTYEGLLSDVRLWNHARTAGEIDSFRNFRLNGQESGLIGYWPMDEGEGSLVFRSHAQCVHRHHG